METEDTTENDRKSKMASSKLELLWSSLVAAGVESKQSNCLSSHRSQMLLLKRS